MLYVHHSTESSEQFYKEDSTKFILQMKTPSHGEVK